MLGSLDLLVDSQGALVERLGLCVLSMLVPVVASFIEQVRRFWKSQSVPVHQCDTYWYLREIAFSLSPGFIIDFGKDRIYCPHRSFGPQPLVLFFHRVDEDG